jgi:hypothetical protein
VAPDHPVAATRAGRLELGLDPTLRDVTLREPRDGLALLEVRFALPDHPAGRFETVSSSDLSAGVEPTAGGAVVVVVLTVVGVVVAAAGATVVGGLVVADVLFVLDDPQPTAASTHPMATSATHV